MFFFLSKLLKFTISPLVWIVALLLLATISRDEFKRKKLLSWGFMLLLFFTSPFIFNMFMGMWEFPLTRLKDLKNYDAVIVMGGVIGYNEESDRIQFLRGADRLFQAIDLYKSGKAKKIIFTGGSGMVLHPEYNEGELVKKYILRLGIPENDFLVEKKSRNTHENAIYTKQLLGKENINGDLLLITSAFHMRRSLGCFAKAGLHPYPFCADKYVKDENKPNIIDIGGLVIPSIEPLTDWTNFIHEMVGYIVYKVAGYV